MTLEELIDVIKEEDFDVTLSGGDPLMHPEDVRQLAMEVKKLGHTVWLYTGYTLDEIQRDKSLSAVLPYIDTIVDGPFIESLKDPDLLFRGSSNQRILHKGIDY